MESDPNSMSAKKVLRKRMKSLLLSLAGDEKRRQSEIVVGKLLQLPAYNSAKRISLYLNMPDEVETLPLLRHALDSGIRVQRAGRRNSLFHCTYAVLV